MLALLTFTLAEFVWPYEETLIWTKWAERVRLRVYSFLCPATSKYCAEGLPFLRVCVSNRKPGPFFSRLSHSPSLLLASPEPSSLEQPCSEISCRQLRREKKERLRFKSVYFLWRVRCGPRASKLCLPAEKPVAVDTRMPRNMCIWYQRAATGKPLCSSRCNVKS